MPATNADGLDIVQPGGSLNPDGFEIVQPPGDGADLNDDGLPIVQPALKTVLQRPPIDTFTPGDLRNPGAQPMPPNLRTMMGADIPGPSNLERPQFDRDGLDRAVDQFKQSRLGQTLFGQGQPEDSPASDIQRHGITSLLGIPGRIGNTAGKGAQALVGDAASAMRGENGGNVKALLNRDGLPIVQASADAKAEAKDQGQTGWESLVSDISLGLADLAPKVAMLEGSPAGAVTKTGAAASIFGTDENGQIDPKNAAFAAAFPSAMKLTSAVTDQAIKGAVDRGLTWAGQPGAQKAIRIAANQATMDALMTAQASPELADLMESDPQEFKRQIAKILGSNLAFAIPEALKSHGGPGGPDAIAPAGTPPPEPAPKPPAPKPAEPEAPVTRDLIAELKASLEKGQIVKPKEEAPAPVTDIEAKPDLVKPDQVSQIRPTEEIVNQPAAEPPTLPPETVATTEEPPSPAQPKKKPNPFWIRPRSDGVPDILDDIQELGGLRKPRADDEGGEYDGFNEAMTGTARLLAKKNATHTPDTLLEELHGMGRHTGIETADQLYDAIKAAVRGRQDLAQTGGGHEEQQRRFWDAISAPKSMAGLEKINVQDLHVGDTFRIKGPGISHEELTVTHVDPDTGDIQVKDGPKLGRQDIPDGTEIWVQKNSSLENASAEGHKAEMPEQRAASSSESPPPGGQSAVDNLKSGEVVFFRFGKSPESGRSRNHVTNDEESGVSVYRAEKTSEGLRLLPKTHQELGTLSTLLSRPGFIVHGDLVGTGSDGEPVLRVRKEQRFYGRVEVPGGGYSEFSKPGSKKEISKIASTIEGLGLAQIKGEREVPTRIESRPRVERDGAGWVIKVNMSQGLADIHSWVAEVRSWGDAKHEFGAFGLKDPSGFEGQPSENVGGRRVPKLRPGEKGTGDLLQAEDAPFNLAGEKASDGERIAREKAQAEKRAAEAKAIEAKQQQQFPAESPEDLRKQLAEDWGNEEPQSLSLSAPEQPTQGPPQQSGFGGWLDDAIKKTDPMGPAQRGEVGINLPRWLAMEVANGALRIVRKAYQATGKISDAIESGVAWLYEQNIKGFNMDEAHAWLTDAVKNAKEVVERLPEAKTAQEPEAPAEPSREVPPTGTRDWRTVKAEMESASEGLRQAIHDHMENGAAERKNAKALAAAKYRLLKDELLTNRAYAADLLTRHEQAMDAGNKAEADSLRTSLEELPPKVMNSVHSELQEQGKLRKSAAPVYGRSLDQLTDWLKREGVDSPKLTLKDRLQRIADRWSDKWQAGKDALDSTRMKLMAAWKTAVKNYKSPPTDTGFRNVIKDWNFAEQWTGLQTRRWMHELKRQVQNPLRRKAISVWMDANGDEGTLRYQASAVPEKYKGIWDTALRLTDSEKVLARQIKQDFAAKLEDALKANLIEKGREDYGVPQVWGVAPEVDPAIQAQGNYGSPGNPGAKLDPRSPFFSFQRSHPTYFDGIMHGGDPRSLDIADLVGVYNEAFHKSLAGRAMIHALKNELAADGQPIIKLSGAVRQVSENEPGAYLVDSRARTGGETSADGRPYRSIDHFALRDWKVASKTPEGKTILVRGDMLVHPDHYEFLKNELMPSPLREGAVGSVINPIMQSGAFMKASKMSFAGFHLMTIGEHMASHFVWPFTNGFEIDLRKPDQDLLVRNGLEIGAAQRMAFEEGLASHGGLFSKIPGLGDLSARITDWMFKEYIPTISMKVGLKVLERNRKRYGGKISDSQVAEITARQMNAASGLTNYRVGGSENNFFARLGANKAWMDLNRMALLAPQFLAARAKVVGQALKPYGTEQRRMLIIQAGVLYVGARVLNQLLDDDPHWELKAAFGVVHNGRMYSIRTIVGDAWHALTDPASFAAGRLSPQVKVGVEFFTQRDMRTGARKEPPFQTEWKPSRYAQNLVVDIAKWMLPIGSEGFQPGAAGREQTKVGSVLAMAGIGTHKYTAQSQVFDWAKDFNRNSPDPATRTYQRHKDADVYGESAYRKLNALLDADKIDAARTEYEALLKDGHSEKQLYSHYRQFQNQAFTGNRQRETDFKATLNAHQLKIYEKALAERQALSERFKKMLPEAVAQ